MKNPKIYIGPAGWSYPDWRGAFYPAKLERGESELRFLANHFNLVEINSTFYRVPSVKSVKNWLHQVESLPDFRFCCKLHQKFTHESGTFSEKEVDEFKNAIQPLTENGRLLTLLLQFPWSFKYKPDNRRYLLRLLKAFSELPLAIEMRHQSWDTPKFLSYLMEKSHTFVNIDQPVIGQSIKITNYVTSKLVYFRFHGRNYDNWFNSDAGQNQRYDYLYSAEEQNEFLELIEQKMTEDTVLIIVFNNHFRGKAIANGFQIKHHFEKVKQNIPESLIRFYPELKVIALKDPVGKTMNLF